MSEITGSFIVVFFFSGRVLKNCELPLCILKGKKVLQRPAKYASARRNTREANKEKSGAKVRKAKVVFQKSFYSRF